MDINPYLNVENVTKENSNNIYRNLPLLGEVTSILGKLDTNSERDIHREVKTNNDSTNILYDDIIKNLYVIAIFCHRNHP